MKFIAYGKTPRQKHQEIVPKKKKSAKGAHIKGALTKREKFILTLKMRMTKGFDVKFSVDTFGISPGQVSV